MRVSDLLQFADLLALLQTPPNHLLGRISTAVQKTLDDVEMRRRLIDSAQQWSDALAVFSIDISSGILIKESVGE